MEEPEVGLLDKIDGWLGKAIRSWWTIALMMAGIVYFLTKLFFSSN